MTPPRLAVSGLRVELADGRGDVVDNINLHVERGHTLGLVGESGSGKTTVALALLGYARRGLRIANGSVIVDGEQMCGRSDHALQSLRGQRVAYVPQDPATALNPAMKVGTQLREVLSTHGIADAEVPERLEQVLAQVSLDGGMLAAYPHQLSGGQQQRVVLAMGFALRPAVIVLDEPTTGLDVTTQRRVLDTIRALCAEHGAAGIFVSHDLSVIGELVDRVAVMYAGRVVELGDKPEVFGSPAHPYTRGLLRAVPSPDRATALEGLEGQPPRPGARLAGCAFAPRCEFSRSACEQHAPELAGQTGIRQLVRCIRATELPAPRSAASGESSHSSAAGAPLLSARELRAGYGATEILHGITLELAERECLAIVGESGSGKTTLARCIVGLHDRWTGELELSGQPLARAARERSPETLRCIQYIFQNPYASLNPQRSVEQILSQPLERFFASERRDHAQRIDAALRDAALGPEFRERYPGDLSGGERQRVAIARALVGGPRLLVCDEITSALDVSVQAAIVETLRRLQDERSLALVFITHNLALVRSVAQRVAVMQEGSVIEAGATEEVLERPQAPYTQRLLHDLPRPRVAPAAAEARG